VPAHATEGAEPVTVTVTPARVRVPMLSGDAVAGVHFAPEGLAFSQPATLTVTLAAPTDRRHLMVLRYSKRGADSNLAPFTAQEPGRVSTLEVPLFHFSGVSVATGTMKAGYFETPAGSPSADYEEVIALIYYRALVEGLSGPWYYKEWADEFSSIMMIWLEDLVTPAFDKAMVAVNANPFTSYPLVRRAIELFTVWDYYLVGWWASEYMDNINEIPPQWPYLRTAPWYGQLAAMGLYPDLDSMIDEHVIVTNLLIEGGVADEKCCKARPCIRRAYFDLMPRWIELAQACRGVLGRPNGPRVDELDDVYCSYCNRFGNVYIKQIGVSSHKVVLSVGQTERLQWSLVNAYQLSSNDCGTMGVDPDHGIWFSKDPEIADVNAGEILGVKGGETVIYLADPDTCASSSVEVTVLPQMSQVRYRGEASFQASGTCAEPDCYWPDTGGICCYRDDWSFSGSVSIELTVVSGAITGFSLGSLQMHHAYSFESGDGECPAGCGVCDPGQAGSLSVPALQTGYFPGEPFHLAFDTMFGMELTGFVGTATITGDLTVMPPMCAAGPGSAPSATTSITLTRMDDPPPTGNATATSSRRW
jgi:hypothetical protein